MEKVRSLVEESRMWVTDSGKKFGFVSEVASVCRILDPIERERERESESESGGGSKRREEVVGRWTKQGMTTTTRGIDRPKPSSMRLHDHHTSSRASRTELSLLVYVY